jgi:hypothetical protein
VPEPPSLPAALLHHADLGREEPWLFRPEGWDWRWWSWGEAARRMSAWAERLAALPAGSQISFSYTALPEAVILDLAIQAAGLVPVPVSGLVPGLVPESWGERFEIDPPAPIPLFHRSPGEGPMPDLAAMAERVQAEIGAPPKGSREIVVLSGPLDRPEERAMLSWATVAGAAVALEPNPAHRIAAAAWVRPTVFHGTAEEIAALRGWVEKEGKGWFRRRPGLPFRRLRRILVTREEGLAAEDEAFWRDRGVGVESGIAAERRNRGI